MSISATEIANFWSSYTRCNYFSNFYDRHSLLILDIYNIGIPASEFSFRGCGVLVSKGFGSPNLFQGIHGMTGFLVIFLLVEVLSGHHWCTDVGLWIPDGNPLDEGRKETCLA